MKKPNSVRECLLPGCGKKLSKQFEFCKEHERLVPPVLLNAVKRTRALYEKHLDFNTVKNDLHLKQWQLARGVAIVAVEHALGRISPEQLAKIIGNRPALAAKIVADGQAALAADVVHTREVRDAVVESETKEMPYVDPNEENRGNDQDRE